MVSLTSRRLACLALLAVLGCERKADPSPDSARPAVTEAPALAAEAAEPVEIPEVRIRPGAPTAVKVDWNVPAGTALNDDAPFRVRWNRSDGLAEAPGDVKSTGSAVKDGFRVTVEPMPGAPNATLGGVIDLVICDEATHSVCVPLKRSLELGFVIVKDAPAETTVAVPLPHAKAR